MAIKSRIDSEADSIEALFKKVEKIDDDELKSHWARYLCIRVAGLLENSIQSMIVKYAKARGSSEVSNFIETKSRSLTNMNCEKISQCLGAFNKNWYDKFKTDFSSEGKEAIDSVVGNRHLIGHGGYSGLTYCRMKDYYGKIRSILSEIEGEFFS